MLKEGIALKTIQFCLLWGGADLLKEGFSYVMGL